jgi:signal transduction histidine kinase
MGSNGRASLAGIILLLFAAFKPAVAAPQRVLLLHSFGQDFSPWNTITPRFREELRKQSPYPIDLYEASLQAERFGESPAPEEGPFIDYLNALFPARDVRLIVAMGAPATRFVLRNRQRLFPSSSMLIASSDVRTFSDLTLTANDTACPTTYDPAVHIDHILRLLPDTTNIVVATGASPSERFWTDLFRLSLQRFSRNVTFHWFTNLSADDMVKRVAELPQRSAIYYPTVRVDAHGAPQEGDIVLRRFIEMGRAPIFTHVDSHFGKGIVGGPMFSSLEIGKTCAAVAVRILGGEAAGDIKVPPVELATPVYDWRELQRWHISESVLPPGSIVQFRQPTAWELFRGHIIAISAALAFLSILSAWLLFEHHRRRKAEVESRRRLLEVMHLSRTAEAGALSVSFAHELTQPLASIMLNAETAERLLDAGTPNVARLKEILGDIRQTDGYATEIISHVTKLLKRRSEVEAREFDLNEAIADAMQILEPEARRRNVALSVPLTQRPLPVRADSIHLQQVILNLARNGMDAMADMAPNARRMTIQTTLLGESTVEVSVSDSGTGIPESKLSEVFDTFYTTKEQGTGLGLSIARTIVETYGGKIRAENRPLGGAVFRFTLPLLRPASTLGRGRDVHGQWTRDTERQSLGGPFSPDRRRRVARGERVEVDAAPDGNACYRPDGHDGGS